MNRDLGEAKRGARGRAVRQAGVWSASLLALALAPAGVAAAPASAGGDFPAIAATVPRAEEAASRHCWRQQSKRVCQKVEREEPVGSDPYYYFAPNTMPTARRGWKLGDPVNHPPPSPR
jgi:hypothetical protein